MGRSKFRLGLLIAALIVGVGASAFWAGHASSGSPSLEVKTYQPGWANVPWLSDTMPIGAALSPIAGSVGVVYYLDPDTGGWKRYIPGRPDVSNLTTMAFGKSYLMLFTSPVQVEMVTQREDICLPGPTPTQCPTQVIDQQDLDEVCGLIDDVVWDNLDLQGAWGFLKVALMFSEDIWQSDWMGTDFAVGDIDRAVSSLQFWAIQHC